MSDTITMRPITVNERKHYEKEKAHYSSPEEEFEQRLSKEKKECTKCGITRLLMHYRGNTSGRDPFDKHGLRLLRPECADCTKKTEEGKQQAKKIAEENGIPYLAPEGTLCAICDKPAKRGDRLVFDHDHTTKTFRGYLHNSCNRALGVHGDNLDGLLTAVNYLNRDKKKIIQQDDGSLVVYEE